MTENRFINTNGGNCNGNIQGNYIQGNYYSAEKAPSLIKSELSREISNINNEIKKLEIEIEQLRTILLSYLPVDKRWDFLLGNKKIEDNLEWLIVAIEIKEAGEINGIRDKYKQKIYELESQMKHLSYLENEMNSLGRKEKIYDIYDIVSFVKKLLS